MKYSCIEKTLEIVCGEVLIRLWIDITDSTIEQDSSLDIIRIIKNFILESKEIAEEDVIQFIEKNVKHVNAVQVLDLEFKVSGSKEGVVAYLVEFKDDIHG